MPGALEQDGWHAGSPAVRASDLQLAFADPEVFNLRRKPNKHLAFGAGPHYCVGHSLARLTLRILFHELFDRFDDFRAAGPAQRLQSNFVSGFKHIPITAKRRTGGRTA